MGARKLGTMKASGLPWEIGNHQGERKAEQVRAEAACHQIMFLPVVPPQRTERDLGLEACDTWEWGGRPRASAAGAWAPLSTAPLHNEDPFSIDGSLGGFPACLKLLPENKNLTSF